MTSFFDALYQGRDAARLLAHGKKRGARGGEVVEPFNANLAPSELGVFFGSQAAPFDFGSCEMASILVMSCSRSIEVSPCAEDMPSLVLSNFSTTLQCIKASQPRMALV